MCWDAFEEILNLHYFNETFAFSDKNDRLINPMK